MDCVPFAFCDAVTSILGKNSLMRIPQLCKSATLKCAAADHYANRTLLSLRVFFTDGNWFYAFDGILGIISLEEVQKIRRKYLHLHKLDFGKGTLGFASSLEEIKSILKFVRPYADGWTFLWLGETDAPKEVLVDLLSLFSFAPFRFIYLLQYEEAFEEILREQIRLSTVWSFIVCDKTQPAVELQTEYERIQTEARLARCDKGGRVYGTGQLAAANSSPGQLNAS